MKVMLVDDDVLISEGLRKSIEWDSIGAEVVSVAYDGLEAIEMFKEKPVDIVITDINMPRCSGLELLSTIKSLNENVYVIVLSGYDNFSYAKKAIEFGVQAYLLKPAALSEIKKEVQNIVVKNAEKKKKENTLINKNIKLVEFLNGKRQFNDIWDLKDVLNIDMFDENYIMFNLIAEMNSSIVFEKLKKQKIIDSELILLSDGSIVFIKKIKKFQSKSSIEKMLSEILNKVLDELAENIFVSVSERKKTFMELVDSFTQCQYMKKYILVCGYKNTIFFEDIKFEFENSHNNKVFRFENEIINLNKLITLKKENEVIDYIEQIFSINGITPIEIHDLTMKIIIMIDGIYKEFNMGEKRNLTLRDEILELNAEYKLENIKISLIDKIKKIIFEITEVSQLYSPVIRQVIKKVTNEYKEELSLKVIGYEYNVNISYLGQLFKKEVGMSFAEYVLTTRNNKARDLLLNSNIKINKIAKEVGYIDTSYFCRNFKKQYGICPSVLREIKN